MYLGGPDLNSNAHDVQGYLLNPKVYTAGKIGVSYTLIIHNLFATTFPRYSSWKELPESLKSRYDIYINLPERLRVYGSETIDVYLGTVKNELDFAGSEIQRIFLQHYTSEELSCCVKWSGGII